VCLVSGAFLLSAIAPAMQAAPLEIVSSGFGDVAADGPASTMIYHTISHDGRYVLFRSFATNLRAGPDTNGQVDIYLRDRKLGTTELVSVDSMGNLGPYSSDFASITPDARYVAFQSTNDYVLPDDNSASDVFVRDRLLGLTTRVSVNSQGNQAEPYSAVSGLPDISADDRYVVYQSEAVNLVDNDTNGVGDIFVRDILLGTTNRVSVSSQGTQANGESIDAHISADGRYVVFRSLSTNLVGNSGSDGVFVRDLVNQTTELVSKSTSGQPANDITFDPDISGDGRYVTFASYATNLVATPVAFGQVYRHDRITGTTSLVSTSSSGEVGHNVSESPVVTADGRYVFFVSAAANLVSVDTNGKWDVFRHDCETGVTERLSVDENGTQGTDDSMIPAINDDGEIVAFVANALNWIVRDGVYDPQGYNVFVAPVSMFADGFEK
jgi:hypothetical protein